MLYTLINDFNCYFTLCFDLEQIERLLKDFEDDIDSQIHFNGSPRSYKGIIREPLSFTFPKTDKERDIPDLNLHEGRLFLNIKAYNVLNPLLKDDGEFLPATYENGEAYFYIPFRVAEDVEAINKTLSVENEWNYFNHLVFDEDKVKDWSIFRMRHDGYKGVYCQENVKEAIEQAGLTGLYITTDLANIFPEEQSSVSKPN
ncbi:imm11 family protein [Aliikangiella sp. IMCC44359]|uniref:imm11 family protein n=1 Tax=Aliikangiella sp. IMCC44359 TaxID=3459125 RepID=UPI00403B0EEC